MKTELKNKSFGELIKGDIPVLVDFYADWCGPCRMMPPILKQVKKRLGDRVVIIKIDVDRNPEVSAAYNVRSIPTLMLFKRGKPVWRQAGVVQAQQIESVFNELLK